MMRLAMLLLLGCICMVMQLHGAASAEPQPLLRQQHHQRQRHEAGEGSQQEDGIGGQTFTDAWATWGAHSSLTDVYGVHMLPQKAKVTDMQRQKQRAWDLLVELKRVIRDAYIEFLGPSHRAVVVSYNAFTWRLARHLARAKLSLQSLQARVQPLHEDVLARADTFVKATPLAREYLRTSEDVELAVCLSGRGSMSSTIFEHVRRARPAGLLRRFVRELESGLYTTPKSHDVFSRYRTEELKLCRTADRLPVRFPESTAISTFGDENPQVRARAVALSSFEAPPAKRYAMRLEAHMRAGRQAADARARAAAEVRQSMQQVRAAQSAGSHGNGAHVAPRLSLAQLAEEDALQAGLQSVTSGAAQLPSTGGVPSQARR